MKVKSVIFVSKVVFQMLKTDFFCEKKVKN